MTRALGVDAAGKAGWLGVVLDDGGFVAAVVRTALGDLVAAADALSGEPVAAVGVDIPIGLVATARRSVDGAARTYVGPRRSSVFNAPNLGVVHAPTLADANAWLAAQGFPKMSAQGFALMPRIREAGAVAASDPRMIEVFPEATFRHLAGAPVTGTKKSWAGTVQRLELLAGATPSVVVPWDLGDAGRVPVDDVFDAAAAAYSARRYALGLAEAHGDPAEVDVVTGRRIAMWV